RQKSLEVSDDFARLLCCTKTSFRPLYVSRITAKGGSRMRCRPSWSGSILFSALGVQTAVQTDAAAHHMAGQIRRQVQRQVGHLVGAAIAAVQVLAGKHGLVGG